MSKVWDIKSLTSFNDEKRGLIYLIESPVISERNQSAMLSAIGERIIIDGVVYKPICFERRCLNTPVSIGEKVGILVEIV